VVLIQVLGNAQVALKGQQNHTLSDTLAAIERVRSAFTESIKRAEPDLKGLLCTASLFHFIGEGLKGRSSVGLLVFAKQKKQWRYDEG
jgi:hypothetical protein